MGEINMAKKLTAKQLAEIAWNIWESTQFYLQGHEIKELEALFKKELEAIKNAR
jgi:hypothetical protein